MSNRSLEQLALEITSTRVYLAQLGPKADANDGARPHTAAQESAIAEHLGLRPYPIGAPRDLVKLYRVLGFDPHHLDCRSTMVVALAVRTTAESIICEGDQVESFLIPDGDRVQYVELKYGTSVSERRPTATRGVRRCIRLWNRTGKDLFYHWTQDVHEDDVWSGLVHNNGYDDRESRKTNGYAWFHLTVHKNDNGNIGRQLGDGGSIKIGMPCDVGKDHSTLWAEHISGDVRLYVVTMEDVAVTIARILLSEWET